MFLIGLTGGIATGKSTASRMLKGLSCPVIDADEIAKQVVAPGSLGWRKIKEKFGSGVLLDTGELDRQKLGQIIFADENKRKILNSITHPLIYRVILWDVVKLFFSGHQFCVLDLPLLFETKRILPFLTCTVVVSCSEPQQIGRLISRNCLSETEALQRIRSQMSLSKKREQATYIIDNSGSLEDTEKQVELLYNQWRLSNAQWKPRAVVLCFLLLTSYILFAVLL